MTATADATSRQFRKPAVALSLLAAALVVILALVLTLGPTDKGLSVALGPLFSELLPFRLPRILAAGGAGALLGAAGFTMQRVTGNPIASPEVLGVSSGGGAGLTIALFVFGVPSPAIVLLSMALGSLGAFLVTIAIAGRSGFSAERLLLAGIAISAFCMAIVSMVVAQGDMRSYVLLTWMSGSTNRAGAVEAWTAMITLVVSTAPLFLMTRWLAILPLGTSLSRSIGLHVLLSRLLLAILAALMTAISSFLIGPLSLAGLIAPHLARLLGFQKLQYNLAAAILIGAGVLMMADWLSRVVIYPYQVPVGLFAALIGGPYLLWLLGRKERSA
jgi:iron complex transport system permease protein